MSDEHDDGRRRPTESTGAQSHTDGPGTNGGDAPHGDSTQDVTSLPARAAVALNKKFGSPLEVEAAPGEARSPSVPEGEARPIERDSLRAKAAARAADLADALLRDDALDAGEPQSVDADAAAVDAPGRAATTRGDDEPSTNPPMPMPQVQLHEPVERARVIEAPERPATARRRGTSVVASPLLSMPRVRRPQAIVLFVHGGDVEGHLRMRRGDPAYLRIVPFARDVERRSRGRIGAAMLRLAVRGWNEPEKPAVEDARWALGELRRRYPGVPLAIAGHSMGGRVALDIVGREDVAAVVVLAPWAADVYDAKLFRDVPLLGVHGRRDTVTDPVATKKLIDDVAALGGTARFVSMPGWHAMLWRAGQWHVEASNFLIEHLLADRRSDHGDVTRY